MNPLFKCQYEWTVDDTKAIYYRTMEVNDSVISSKNRKGLGSEISFDSIIYAAEDKQRFMLTSSDGKHFILKKDRFAQGSPEEFKAFLCEKELMI